VQLLNDAQSSKRTAYTNKFLLLTFLLEVIIFAWVTLSIPSDQTNAIFLGYSASRLMILAVFFLLFIFTIIGFIFHKRVFSFFDKLLNATWFVKVQSWVFLLVCSLLWITAFLPGSRFPELQEEVTRLRPLLLTILLILFELLVYFRILLQWQEIKNRFSWDQKTRKSIIWIAIIFVLVIAFFVLLKLVSSSKLTATLLFSSGPFLGPMQVFFGVILFLAVYLVSNQKPTGKLRKPLWIALLVFIGLGAFIVWNFTPLSCADDRPGPYPPNNTCYPQVDDSVYSIGSHYITLGQGVLNHWFTDKPFYMVFLAIGERLLGDEIDKYLIFQIAIIAVMPVLLFLLGRKLSGLAGGLLAAFLSIILSANNIRYYATSGGINVKIENTEILTGFLLVLCGFFLIKYLAGKRRWYLVLLSGGMLGLASLTRLNPVFVLLVIVLFFLGINWKRWRYFFSLTGIFLLGYLIIFVPGMFSSRGESGQFYYLEKIQRILDTRYQRGHTSTDSPVTENEPYRSQALVQSEDGTVELVSYRHYPQAEPVISIDQGQSQGQSQSISPTSGSDKNSGTLVNRLRNIGLTSVNNLYLSLARLPIHFTLHSVEQIITTPGGVTGQKIPIWQMKLSFENYLVLAVNLLFVICGIMAAFNRLRWTAMLPLVIFLGYHLGNGAALTSGERYLEPVQWVILLYFAAGVFAVTRFVLKGNKIQIATLAAEPKVLPQKFGPIRFDARAWVSIGILIFLAALLPAVNLIPDTLAARRQVDLRKEISSLIKQDSTLQKINLKQFLESDQAVIVEGIAYHARQYDSPIYWREGAGFELTVLGESKVYVSNFFGQKKDEYFSDGSRVILLGCVVREKDFWGVETIILNAKGIIQLDHEQHQYFMHPRVFTCPEN
jgi:hypothetical protein